MSTRRSTIGHGLRLCLFALTAAIALCFTPSPARLSAADANSGAASAPPAAQKNVILISWDGADRTVLKDLLKAGKLPNLAALIKEGSIQDIEVTGHQTETKPGHAQMLTGMGPETTGVLTNHNYQPIAEGLTIFERVQKQLGKDKVRTIFVAAKTGNLGGRGPGEIEKDDLGSGYKKGEPYFLTKKHLDAFDAVTRDAAPNVEVALKYLDKFKPYAGSPAADAKGSTAPMPLLCFVHFKDPDSAGHAHGSGSAEYRQGFVDCDAALGKIVEWLKKEKIYDNTLIYVTADHGFDKDAKSHNNAPHITLSTNDKGVTKGGTQADIPATILERFGEDLKTLKPPLVGKSLLGPPTPASQPKADAAEKTERKLAA